MRADLQSIAKESRWTLKQAETRHCSTDAVKRVAAVIAEELPDILVGSVVSDDPMGTPSIWVKGVAPARVHELVDAETVPIEIVEGQPFSFAELDARARLVADALEAQGYGAVTTVTDIIGSGRIPVSVFATPGLPDDPASITATLPVELRPYIVLTVGTTPG
ncbi:MAG: hypothetical protein U0667_14455 [Chloroflexota bacterium]